MGILELHFHDSEFSWGTSPRESVGRSLSLGGESGTESDRGATESPSAREKFRLFGMLALVVGFVVAFNRIRRRRAREAAESGEQSSGRRLSLSRSD